MTTTHRIDDSRAEQQRLEAAGSEIARSTVDSEPVGPLRVWPGGLAMGRTIGDLDAGPAVCAEPDVWQVLLTLGSRSHMLSERIYRIY